MASGGGVVGGGIGRYSQGRVLSAATGAGVTTAVLISASGITSQLLAHSTAY